MHLIIKLSVFLSLFTLSSCLSKGQNAADPYESINRKTYAFNTTIDQLLVKPPARLYATLMPAPIRKAINNLFNHINLVPTIANDLLQHAWHQANQDSARLVVNSFLGLAGIVDVATTVNLPLHSNDLGLTFAYWGDKTSPYVVIPLLGPSTIRDGMGLLFEYALLTPYPYIRSNAVSYGLFGLRFIDLRAQFLDSERLMDDALDKYSFVRDAYLQHRQYQITGETALSSTGDPFINNSNEQNPAEQTGYVDDATNPVGSPAKAAPNPSAADSSDYVDDIPAKPH